MSDPYPLLDGFAMPAEWRPHSRCWMAWPVRLELWGAHHEAACRAYARAARAIAEFEPVTMLVLEGLEPVARLQLGRKVELLTCEFDDSWLRDTGPLFLCDGKGRLASLGFRFNAWGNKFHPYDKDARLAETLAKHLGLRHYQAPLTLEGGAIDVDGEGTLLATEQCVFNANRNPTLDRRQVEERLALHLGARRIIWLEAGLSGDGTDGHVDNLARFVAPGRVVCAATDDPLHPDHRLLAECQRLLRRSSDARGRKLEVVPLPLPRERPADAPAHYVASYANFYLANSGVVLPSFGDAMDGPAQEILARLFPERRAVAVPAGDIVLGGGGLHCITQQQPLGRPAG
ncbi:MAG: agmatine deiminase family protein [Alphaproteobacteria bacterium]|nr:agmatine deiminase family protein [Alphaproteobacteria bacterium]